MTHSKKTLNTLVKDVYSLFNSGHKPEDSEVDALGKAISTKVKEALDKHEPKGTLRGSIIGTHCDRKLYYDVNSPEKAEPMEPWVYLKFLYGHIIEEVVLFLAAQAGHTVTNRQHQVDVGGVKGHIDAVVDGVLVDVKSASGYAINKFKDHKLSDDDPFGYLPQIDFYSQGMKDVAEVPIRGEVGFIAVDKSNGQIVVDRYRRSDKDREAIVERVNHAASVVAGDVVPDRGFDDVPDGVGGNRKLCTQCSYCPYKQECWSDANGGKGLMQFIYSTGPRWLTKMIKEPRVTPHERNF